MVTKRPAPQKAPAKAARRVPKKGTSLDPTLWSDITAMFASVPKSDWAGVPRDAARHFDELMEGHGR